MIPTLPKVEKYGEYTIHDEPQNRLGEYFCNNKTNQLFVYLRANEDLSEGAALSSVAPISITTGLQAAAAGSKQLKFGASIDLDELLPRVPNDPKFSEYVIVGVVGSSESGILYSHTKRAADMSWDTDNLLLETALAENASIDIAIPWLAREAGADLGVIAIAQRAIAAGKYFWGLVEGLGKAYADAAVAAGVPLYVITTEGEGDDPATASTEGPYAYTLRAQSTADRLVDVIAACPARIGIVPLLRAPQRISYEHPEAAA